MSTNKTKNLNLHSWVETDPVLMSEFNENFTALDTAVKNTNTAITTKVSAAVTELTGMIDDVSDSVGKVTNSVSKVSNTVSGLSDSVDEISDTVSGITNTISDMEAASLKICTGSYTGDGGKTVTLYFPCSPCLVFVHCANDHVANSYITTPISKTVFVWHSGSGYYVNSLVWTANSMTITGKADTQILNTTGEKYYYLALGT